MKSRNLNNEAGFSLIELIAAMAQSGYQPASQVQLTSDVVLRNSITPDPKRLLLKSYGFGPQGAKKRLELMVNKENLEFEIPAGMTLRGADDCTAFSFDSGSSGTKVYSGVDLAGVEAQRRLLRSRRAMKTISKLPNRALSQIP